MANIFVCYADHRFYESQNRIARQAKRIGIFDKILKYSPKDLPSYISSSPLFAFSKGGGYWVWKPYVIWHTLQFASEGDIVWYCDSGCTLNANSPEWQVFLEQMEHHNAIFFQYRDNYNYGWGIYPDKAAYKYWAKPSVKEYFLRFIDNSFLEFGNLLGGFIIVKKTRHPSKIIENWYKTILFYPELVVDAFGFDLSDKDNAYHTHDQAILAPIVYHFHEEDHALILPETAESHIGQPAVIASRWMQGKMPFPQLIKHRIWLLLHGKQ